MAILTENRTNVVVAFSKAAREAGYFTVGRAFGVMATACPANSDYAPAFSEGAQTSDRLLDFLYGVTRQAH